MCFSHYTSAKDLEEIVLEDIRAAAKYITLDEQNVREDFIRHNTEIAGGTVKTAQKELKAKQRRLENYPA